jgi:O-antigen/teichoic acid export membrane protein
VDRREPGVEAWPPPQDATDGRRILVNTAFRAAGDLVSKLASIALYVVMARRLGDAGFGVFTFAFSLVTLVTALGDLGQTEVLIREVARDRQRVHGYFGDTVALKLLLSVPALAIALGGVFAAGVPAETRVVVTLIGLAVMAELLMDTSFGVFQAFERMSLTAIVLIAQRTVTAAAGIAALLLGAGVVAVSAIYLAGALLALALSLGLLLRRVVRVGFHARPRRWARLMRAAVPIGLTTVFWTVLSRVDASMLAAFRSDAVVGNYGAAYRLLESTLFLSWSVGSAVFPVLSRLGRSTQPPVGLVYERSVKLLLGVTVPIAVGAAVLADGVVELLYGTEFATAADALRLLAPTIALYPVSYLAGLLLVSQDRQVAATIAYGVVAAENVLLNLVLIPRYSLYGAAVGTSISEVLVMAALVWSVAGPSGPVRWGRAVAGPVVAGAAAAVTMYGLRGVGVVPAALTGGIVYAFALLGFERLVYPGDLRSLREIVRGRPGARP